MKRIHLITLGLIALCCLLPLYKAAAQQLQKFSVAAFEPDPFDRSAQSPKYERIDNNGDRMAIVKVVSNNPDDDLSAYLFNFGLLRHEDVKDAPAGERWVYVQKNAKNVTISRPGYANVKHVIPQGLEAGKVYTLRLSVVAAPVRKQLVRFDVKPAGTTAVVFVRSSRADAAEEMIGTTNAEGVVAKTLELGAYTYRVVAESYHTSDGGFSLTEPSETHVETVNLRPNFAEVTLRVDADADIYVGGELQGRKTWQGRLRAGAYQVETRAERHRPAQTFVEIQEGQQVTIDLTPPTPITGVLAITSTPLGATVAIDGHLVGTTPCTVPDLIIGAHSVTLSLTNYRAESQTIEIKEGETMDLDMELKDVARMTLHSRPIGAHLWLDGKDVGTAPYTAEMVSGDYDVRLTYPRYLEYHKTVHLDSSNPEHTISLQRLMQIPTAFYGAVSFQAGSLMGVTGIVGAYVSNINFEVSYLQGLSTSEDIFWNTTGSTSADFRPQQCAYKPKAFALRAGYGIISGTRLRITPQVGAELVSITSDSGNSKCHAVSLTVGARADYGLASSIGLFVAPEGAFALKKSSVLERIVPISSTVKGWTSGINVRLGAYVQF